MRYVGQISAKNGLHSQQRAYLATAVVALAAAVVTSAVVLAYGGQDVAVPKAAQANPKPGTAQPDESQRLLELANQLQAEMGKTTKDQLSVAVLRKADALEKLAHQMRTH